METSFRSPLQLQHSSLMFDCESLLGKSAVQDPSTDLGYQSASSSLSPASSVDSFCFSPASLQLTVGGELCALDALFFCKADDIQTASQPQAKKSRSRYPGKKRQTASEREKLRMRDLTKALHHLRTYLPTSVAPAGQSLTKIETLRLAIRYITHLSDQLGLSEDVLEQRRRSCFQESVGELSGQEMASCGPEEGSWRGAAQQQLPSSCRDASEIYGDASLSDDQFWMPH